MRSTLSDYAFVLLRIVSGLLFLGHGLQKVFGILGGHAMPLTSRLGAAGIIETVCGAMITIGLYTPIAAFVAAGEMVFAYFLGHAPRGWLPLTNGGEQAVLYGFIFLYVATRADKKLSVSTRTRL